MTATALLLLAVATPSGAENLVALAANHPDAAVDLASTGNAAPPYQPLRMEVYLKPRNQAQFERLLQDQQNPASPRYHKWLTPTEYDQQFGPTDDDVAQVTQWLTKQGFTVTFSSAHEGRITFDGIVATAQTAFNVSIAGSSDGKHFGNVQDPQVPASLGPKISHLAGLDNLHDNLWNEVIDDPPYNNTSGDPDTTPFFGPNDITAFNDETPLLNNGFNGAGQCVALSEGSDVDQASLAEFNIIFNLPAFVTGTNYFAVFPDGQPSAPGIDQGGAPYGEAMLDVEYAHGLAPGASIVLYAADAGQSSSDPTQALVDSAVAAVSDTNHHCASIAISWAQCGLAQSFYQNLDSIFARGASEGQSIFVATGDVGTAAPSPNSCAVPPKPAKPNILENAGSPSVTAVGASMFTATYDNSGKTTNTLANTEQAVWKYSRVSKKLTFLAGAAASTGGYSSIFPRPSWQNGVAGITGTKRAVPDLVLGGGALGGTGTVTEKGNTIVITGNLGPAPNFWECFDSGLIAGAGRVGGYECRTTGGTSIVPPQFAGIFAIVAQKSGKLQGLINPQLYAMAKANLKTPSAVGLVDITTGNNAYAPVAGKPAKKGFDLATGWGSIDINQFVTSFITFVPPAPKPNK